MALSFKISLAVSSGNHFIQMHVTKQNHEAEILKYCLASKGGFPLDCGSGCVLGF